MKTNIIKRILSVAIILSTLNISTLFVSADEFTVSGYRDEYSANSNYDEKHRVEATQPGIVSTQAIGTLKINGAINQPPLNEIPMGGPFRWVVESGEVNFSYTIKDIEKKIIENYTDYHFHVVEDSSKKIGDISLSGKIGKGAIVIESSLDRKTWHKEKEILNIFDNNLDSIYTARKAQLTNGCFYRVTVAYKVAKNTGKKEKIAFWSDKYEYKKYKEVYEFYLYYDLSQMNDQNQLVYELGDTINTGKDNGFSGKLVMGKNDPHLGWKLGQFKVTGFTKSVSGNGKLVFLKNVGDQIALSFQLLQDINKLNGDKNLTISRDWNGFDSEFDIEETDMGRGFLIIQYTDSNRKSSVEKYQNYLESSATTTADTTVGLFEEGDYKVALDYEIKKKNTIGEDYYNYRIAFDFSVRNGNCMIFPFDVKTNKELTNESYTPNGFKIDWAKSKYLTIEVQYSTLVNSATGLAEDIRYYRPSKDGDSYTEPGIYRLKIINDYLSTPVNKTIYVGDIGYLKALSSTGMSVDELNSLLESGATVNESGEIIVPEKEIAEEASKPEPSELKQEESARVDDEEQVLETSTSDNNSEALIHSEMSFWKLGIPAFIILFVGMIIVFIRKRNPKNEEK